MHQNNELLLSFLKKILLGQKTKIDNSEEVIKKCISLAYKDMMDSGKYYLDSCLQKGDKQKTENNDNRKENFLKILQGKDFVFSRDLIAKTCEIFGDAEKIKNSKGYATRYGLAQKLVNMTFKYLYVFSKETGKDIDFSRCDCPLDSIIIDSIIIDKLNLTQNYVWSNGMFERKKQFNDI